ncbi:NACHT, LRR and PYD domains-containing protein 14 [Salarias fasciatus]|uniref:NACHT, LRR and PYD domains-containing protein 14 n=1 Tax=Salarias fasciatus TaxID=181472 RepID=UPI001176F2CA|nr:NACHT, LRR and PYD domains-containing protein 14-like [Salarias fasciatus]
MDKAAVLSHFLESKGKTTLLGGELPASVISSNKYISGAQGTEEDWSSVDEAIRTALSAENRAAVLLVGPEGSGKTTTLKNMVVDWAKGKRLQSFSHVFYFQFRELNSLQGAFSLESLIQHSHSHTPASVQPLLQKPENVLLLFDGLSEYRHSPDPSVHSLCSDPSQEASVSCLVASLLHGSLLKGAASVVATRPTESLKCLSGTHVEMLGFLKPQRESYFNRFFTDPATAKRALGHMERTVGFYDISTSPRFCWTLCSVYKSLIDSGANLPETLTQLFVEILVHLLHTLSLSKASNRELVLALGRLASHCSLGQCSGSATEQMDSFGLQQFVASVDAFLESDRPVLSFHTQLIQDFILAICWFMDKSTYDGLEKRLEQDRRGSTFLQFFLSGLSEPLQRRPLEILLGEFNRDQIEDFRNWLKSNSEATLQGFSKDEHYRYFHLLHQAQNDSLVKEVITSTRRAISYGELSLQDAVALNYVITCVGGMETLNLYRTRSLSEEVARVLAPAMSLSQVIELADSSLGAAAVQHLASALSRGVIRKLDLSNSSLGDEKLKILCSGLKDCKLHNLNLQGCRLTKASCEDLASVLSSDTSQLRLLQMSFNELCDEGFSKLCKTLHSPHSKLEEIQVQNCALTAASMNALSAALCSNQSPLRKINLMQNHIGDDGMETLFKSLKQQHCKLQSLNVFDNEISGACCAHVKEALMTEHCCLSELDLSVNDVGQEGALQLCQALSQPSCPMEKLGLTRCGLTMPVFKELGSVLKSGTSQLKSLTVGLNDVGDAGVKPLWDALAHPGCLLEELDVEMTGLTDACVEDLCVAIRTSKTLKSVELRNNSLTDASVPALVEVMQDSPNMLELNLKYNDFSEDVFEMMDQCSNIRY